MSDKQQPLSPFDWKKDPRPSIFANDPAFMAKGDNALSTSQIMTEVVKKKRKENKEHGTIYGLSKDREKAILKSKQFHVYSKAGSK